MKKSISFLSILLIVMFVSSAIAQKAITVGEVTAAPGEKKSGYIIVPGKGDEKEVKLPITVINGAKSGPVLGLTAGVHGYEYPPVLAFQRIIKELNPAAISGTVIIVHVVNIPSFLRRTVYYGPMDGQNLNRVFPGKENGTMSERIAYQITKEVIDQSTYLIDNHCGDGNEDLMPYLYCTKTGKEDLDTKIRGLAEHYGFKVIVNDEGRPTDEKASVYLSNTAIVRGIPAITIESGKLGRTDTDDITRIIHGTFNILKYLKMMKGEPVIPFKAVWIKKYSIIQSEHDGIFYPLVSRGDHVQKDELAGYLTDFFGNVIQKVYAPYNGIILYIVATPPMSTGEPMVSVGLFY